MDMQIKQFRTVRTIKEERITNNYTTPSEFTLLNAQMVVKGYKPVNHFWHDNGVMSVVYTKVLSVVES